MQKVYSQAPWTGDNQITGDTQTKIQALILTLGIDGWTTDISNYAELLKRFPGVSFRLIICLNEVGYRLAQAALKPFFVSRNGVHWCHFSVTALVMMSRTAHGTDVDFWNVAGFEVRKHAALLKNIHHVAGLKSIPSLAAQYTSGRTLPLEIQPLSPPHCYFEDKLLHRPGVPVQR
jgi:hypothetical protein